MPDKACSHYLIWSWKQSSEGGRAGIIFSILQLKTLVNWFARSHNTPDMTGMRLESRSLYNLFRVLLTAHRRRIKIFPAPPSPYSHQLNSNWELTTTELVFILLTHLCLKEKYSPDWQALWGGGGNYFISSPWTKAKLIQMGLKKIKALEKSREIWTEYLIIFWRQ